MLGDNDTYTMATASIRASVLSSGAHQETGMVGFPLFTESNLLTRIYEVLTVAQFTVLFVVLVYATIEILRIRQKRAKGFYTCTSVNEDLAQEVDKQKERNIYTLYTFNEGYERRKKKGCDSVKRNGTRKVTFAPSHLESKKIYRKSQSQALTNGNLKPIMRTTRVSI